MYRPTRIDCCITHSTLGVGVIKKRRRATRCAPCTRERQSFIDNLLVRIHCMIVVIRWTGLAPWVLAFPFPGSLASTFLNSRGRFRVRIPDRRRYFLLTEKWLTFGWFAAESLPASAAQGWDALTDVRFVRRPMFG